MGVDDPQVHQIASALLSLLVNVEDNQCAVKTLNQLEV